MITRSAAAIALMFAPAAFSQTYVVPTGECGPVTFNITRGAETITADQVSSARVYLPRERLAAKLAGGPRSLIFNANVPDQGVVMAAVDLKPQVIGNETRTEHAKAFIFCGATPMADWQRAADMGLDIIPQGWNGPRPTMKAGDSMRFIAVEPAARHILPDVPMELDRADGSRIATGTPDRYSGMDFPYPQPGRYVVVATYRRADPQQPDHLLVDTSTLTFDVK